MSNNILIRLFKWFILTLNVQNKLSISNIGGCEKLYLEVNKTQS